MDENSRALGSRLENSIESQISELTSPKLTKYVLRPVKFVAIEAVQKDQYSCNQRRYLTEIEGLW